MKDKQIENISLTVIFLLILIVFTGIFFDFYYDLNDDVLMKDILAGVYTGEPESRNIQMLYGISAFISFLYRLVPAVPWYGIFLCACQFGSLGLIVHRMISMCKTRGLKVIMVAAAGVIVSSMMLYHMVIVQYTITCTMLAAAAVFLFYTSDSTLLPKDFIKKNLAAVVLVWTAYLIRSEMLLLVLPIICIAGVCKWGKEQTIFTKCNFIKYLGVFGAILLGIGIGQATHLIAHSSPEWRTFTEYFDNRTELYDFQNIPEYEENQVFYESIGLSKWERELLDNYNFGLSEEIDEDVLCEIAEYASSNKKEETDFLGNLIDKFVHIYCYELLTRSRYYPFNLFVIILYVAVTLCGALKGYERLERINKKAVRLFAAFGIGVWKPLILFGMRTILWMFIILRGRDPSRITHSLFFIEFILLAAMLLMEIITEESKRSCKIIGGILGAAVCIAAALFLPSRYQQTKVEQLRREEVNITNQNLQEYCRNEKNQENFYFLDVYSSVGFSEKMFSDVDNSLTNYDIMGGWACKSPLYRKKLKNFGIDIMEDALISMDNVYVIAEKDNDMLWLYGYYEEQGIQIAVEKVDEIKNDMYVYDIIRQ